MMPHARDDLAMWVTYGRERLWIEEFDRQEFLAERWQYRPGQHVTIIAPTGWGKTTFTHQLLEYTARPDLPVINFALKPKDNVMSSESKRRGYKIVRDWPPFMMGHPNGWTLWPRMTDDMDLDDVRIGELIRKVLIWAYRNASKKPREGLIVNADEMEEIQRLLAHLGGRLKGFDSRSFLRGLYRRMRSNGGGMWTGCQAPRWLVTDAYSQAQHLLLGNDPDERNRDRYGEIGGVNPKAIEAAVVQLPDHAWLYLRRAGRVMCVIGP